MNSREQADLQLDMRAKQLLHEAGYSVEGFPTPKPRGFFGRAMALHRPFVALVVAGTIGVVANLIGFFALAFVFAAEPSNWVEWYFGGDGWCFLAVTIADRICCVPSAQRADACIATRPSHPALRLQGRSKVYASFPLNISERLHMAVANFRFGSVFPVPTGAIAGQ